MSDIAIGLTVGVAVLGLLYTLTNNGRPKTDLQRTNYGSYDNGANNNSRNSYDAPDEIRTGGKKSKTSKKSTKQKKSKKRS